MGRGPGTMLAPICGWVLLLGIGAADGWAQSQRPAQATPAVPTRQEYLVGRGDVLQIVVRKEPDLSRDVLVRLDGWITVPLLGDLQAEGQTPTQISEAIARGLTRFINAPLVTVAVGQALSARAYVIGQVEKTCYLLTLMNLLALIKDRALTVGL